MTPTTEQRELLRDVAKADGYDWPGNYDSLICFRNGWITVSRKSDVATIPPVFVLRITDAGLAVSA
jgi:hypothetical protein